MWSRAAKRKLAKTFCEGLPSGKMKAKPVHPLLGHEKNCSRQCEKTQKTAQDSWGNRPVKIYTILKGKRWAYMPHILELCWPAAHGGEWVVLLVQKGMQHVGCGFPKLAQHTMKGQMGGKWEASEKPSGARYCFHQWFVHRETRVNDSGIGGTSTPNIGK